MYREILKEVSTEFENRRDRQERDMIIRTEKLYKKIPAIKRIDEEIFKIGLSMSKYIIGNPQGYEENAKRAKEMIEKLKMEKAYLMTESNIPQDYMERKYDC